MSITPSLPHWDMSVVYPGLASPEFAEGFIQAVQAIADLAQLFDTLQIHKQSAIDADQIDDRLVQAFETAVTQYNAVLASIRTLSVYISCFVNTDAHDDLAQARASELKKSQMQLSQLGIRFTAWIGSFDVETLIQRSTIAGEHAYILRKAKVQATHMMSPAEESLASELNMSSGSAWAKLHGDLTARLTVELEIEGEMRTLPMSMVRNLAYEADRELRRKAYEAELMGWECVALPLAAAMNSIKGQVNVLTSHRNWESPLAATLFMNNIDQQTFDAMLSAARASFPDFRRFLQAKAVALKLPRLTWYDLFAPLGKESQVWDFEKASAFIVEQFGSYSGRLADFAARAFREQWVDAEPREGKRDGAYCTSLRKEESRILANFKPNFTGISTLAHELGHGYHNLNLVNRTQLQHSLPMTLAETASIFCETIIRHGALSTADSQERMAILDVSLQGSCGVVVDILSRFFFEQNVFARRQQRELSVDELNNLMLEAQRETYGEGLDSAILHPYMWAVKSHYYSTGLSYYNYPYMFGLLFGLGLYARYQQDPQSFKQNYDDLLSSTGLADAATLAERFGIDLHSEAFWTASLDVVREDIDSFVQLV